MRLGWQQSWGMLGLFGLILSGCGMLAATPSPTASVAAPPTSMASATARLPAPSSATTVGAPSSPTAAEAAQTTPRAEQALHYLLPPRLPASYHFDQRDPAFADETGFSVQLRSDAPARQNITIEGGAQVEEVARAAEEALRDPQATGAVFEAIVVRGQPGVFQSSGYGSRVTWREQGLPYSVLSPYDRGEIVKFIDTLEILDRATWQRQNNLETFPKTGMWIVEVEPGSVAAEAGFYKGQVLISLNDTFIEAAGTANEVIARNLNYPIQAIVWDKERRLALSFTPKDRLIGITLCVPQRCAGPAGSDTPAPVPPVVVPPGRALYPCQQGLCLATLGSDETRVIATFTVPVTELAGFALSSDGAQLTYGIATETGAAEIYLQSAAGGEPRKILSVKGAENGLGDLEGYGVIGFSDDNRQLIFEDQAQVFAANLDGSRRRPVTEQILYGASTTHFFALSPDSAYLMVTSSGDPNAVRLYRVANGDKQAVSLPPDQQAIDLFGQGPNLLIARFDPPVDLNAGNPATKDRTTIGYLVTDADGRNPRPLQLTDGAEDIPSLISHITGTHALFQKVDGSYLLFDLKTGQRTPVKPLPGRNDNTTIALAIVE